MTARPTARCALALLAASAALPAASSRLDALLTATPERTAPTYWSQGNGNFRDVNQNRRSENCVFPGVDSSNIETFFNLIQLDGNNPLVIQAEKFVLSADLQVELRTGWSAGNTPAWAAFFIQAFSPGQLLAALVADQSAPERVRPWFDRILSLADKVQGASHGEGYWVDHWIYNLDLLDSYAALYPDRLRALLIERRDFTYFDNDHIVQPRDKKYVLRKDGSVRQLHAVVKDADKAALIALRTDQPNQMRTQRGLGEIYRTTLLAKIVNLVAVKTSLLDPSGIGLEMEAEKPGWCDALNGLPGLVGSSTHEALSLRRWLAFTRRAVQQHLGSSGALRLPAEVAELVRSITVILAGDVGTLSAANPSAFFAIWSQLASCREAFRAETRLGITGNEIDLSSTELLQFVDTADAVLQRGLAQAVDASGLPVSYYTHEIAEFDRLPMEAHLPTSANDLGTVHVRAVRFQQRAVGAAFLEGAVHTLRALNSPAEASALRSAVRESSLYDDKLGMYRVNTPLEGESFEIGRSRVFSPGWLENESIFLHMHYKFLLETLRSGLAGEFFDDLQRGLVAFQKPEVYGRSPLENSSFIASSRFPDAKVHGVGFVARLSGATAEWISMVLHMGLGANPFQMVDGSLRFEPRPILADWLFTTAPTRGFGANSYGFKLFGHTWVVYVNPSRRNTFGPGAVAPVSFELTCADSTRHSQAGSGLTGALANDLRDGKLASLVIQLA